jgi:AraC-like DNA-binding protein
MAGNRRKDEHQTTSQAQPIAKQPARDLQAFIEVYLFTNGAGLVDEEVFPPYTGSLLTLSPRHVVTLGAPYNQTTCVEGPAFFGPLADPVCFGKNGETIDGVTVKLTSVGAARLLDDPLADIEGVFEKADSLLPGLNLEILRESIEEASTVDAQVQRLDRFFRQCFMRPTRSLPRGLGQMLCAAETTSAPFHDQHFSVDTLFHGIGVSARQLRRYFDHHVGLSPKRYLSILRIKQAMHILGQNPDVRLTTLAQRLGYTDQAHFSRHFRSMALVPPSAYRDSLRHQKTAQFV